MRAGRDGAVRAVGVRCPACGYGAALSRPRCPECGADVEEAEYGPGGRVWSATVVRIPVPGRQPPWGLAYVDLDGGARVLAHVRGAAEEPLAIGAQVAIAGIGAQGDLEVEVAP